MSSTNKTSNLELSQFIGTDSPKWLTDYNSDMQKIDAGVNSVQTQANATDLVVSGHTSSIQSNTQSISDQQTAITSLRSDVTAAQGSINTINSLIGNGEPTTTDKTIIGAINELAADSTALSNTVTGLQAVLAVHVDSITPESGYTFDGTNLKHNTLSVMGRFRFLTPATIDADGFTKIGTIDKYTPANSIPFQCYRTDSALHADGYINANGEIYAYLTTTDTSKYFVATVADFI